MVILETVLPWTTKISCAFGGRMIWKETVLKKLPTFCSVSHSNAFTDMHLPMSSKVFLNVHDAKNSRVFAFVPVDWKTIFFSIKWNLCPRVSVLPLLLFFSWVCFRYVRKSFCSVDGTWQIVKYRFSKSTIVSAHGLENKTTASQKSEKNLKSRMDSYYDRIF